jgi:tRNA pseudouridine55 synthase
VVGAVRRALRIKQVGHTGTLDPFASGLLLVCIGPATRLAEYITPLPKTYLATMRLGEATDTDDVSPEAIEAALMAQVGEIDQVPPAYSAKKVAGERMYDVARRGGEVDLPPVRVTIHSLRVVSIDLPDVVFEVECGSGTYIRAIARDVGRTLGVGGHLPELRRTRIGAHDVTRAVPVDQLGDEARVASALIAPADAVSHLAHGRVDEQGVADLGFGRAVAIDAEIADGETVAVLGPDGGLLAIGEAAGGRVRPRKVFAAGA